MRLTLIPHRTTFGKDGPLTDTFLVRTDNFWQPKMVPRTGFGTGPVLVPDEFFCDRPSLVVIILQNGTEYSDNTNSYIYKSSLQCLISTSCISLDRAQQPYMLVLILLELEG